MTFVLIDETANAPAVQAPGLALEVMLDDPCPRVGVTVTGLSPTTESTVTVWRSVPGEGRAAVRGLRRTKLIDATYVVDYEAPLGRDVTYTLEVTGPVVPATLTGTVAIDTDTVWFQDPLDPTSAVPVATWDDGADIWFAASALTEIGYAEPASLVRVMGARYPTALGGGRSGPSSAPFDVYTSAIEAANRLRMLLDAASPLLVRTIPLISPPLPALTYLRADVAEQPVDRLMLDRVGVSGPMGGDVTFWSMRGDLVAGPSINLLVPTWTYAQVSALYETYAAAAARGGTYLDWMRDPTP